MADSKKKKTADEIVDDVASELGVDADDSSAEESEANEVEDSEAEEVEDSEAEDDDSDEEDSEAEEEDEPKKAAPKKKAKAKENKKPKADKKASGKGHSDSPHHHRAKSIAIFTSGGDDPSDSHLGLDDLDAYDEHEESYMPYLIAVAIALVVGAGAIMWAADGDVDNVVALAKGELRERKIEEAKRLEDEFREAQLAKLEKFGNLLVSGNPLYATLRLDGEIQYGQTSTGEWRELQVTPTTAFQNVKVKQTHKLEVNAPGFDPATMELTEGMWQGDVGGSQFGYQYVANLQPKSAEDKQELDARVASDTENEFYGTITIATTPPGAKVIYNNFPLVDKDGVELKTPVTFDRYYKKDEKTGKLEELMVRVDSVIDQGSKLQVQLADETMPKYVTAIQRQMWECTWKDEATLKKMKFKADKDSIQKKCDYSWNLNLDFNALKSYIQKREEEKKRIEAQNKQFQLDMAAKKKELENQ